MSTSPPSQDLLSSRLRSNPNIQVGSYHSVVSMDSSRGLHLPYDQSSLLSRRAYLFCYEQPRPLSVCVKSHSLGCRALQPCCSPLVEFAIDSRRRRCIAWASFASLVWSLALTISSYPKVDWSPRSNQLLLLYIH